jgi:hypothetical protein
MSQPRVKLPAGYAPAYAMGFADSGGNLVLASASAPLPVAVAEQAAPSVPNPLTGNTSASIQVGPFEPAAGRPVILQLDGSWSGTVQLLRAPGAGSAAVPVTVGGLPWASFSGNACEPVWEESQAGAQLFLDIALVSGNVSYQVSQ